MLASRKAYSTDFKEYCQAMFKVNGMNKIFMSVNTVSISKC